MLSILRGTQPVRRKTATENPIYYENNTSSVLYHPRDSYYFSTHTIPTSKSFFNPPLHVHLFQSEEFHIRSGTGIFNLPTASDVSKRTTVLRSGDKITLPEGKPHNFQNASDEEPLVLDVKIQPSSTPFRAEERFFRNFLGYLEDCTREKVEPSLFQLCLFLWTIDTPLAIPVPGSDRIKCSVSRGVCWILGVGIGQWLLGYQSSYPEYFDESTLEQ